jgi:hypothetical protein
MRRRFFIFAALAFVTVGLGACKFPSWMLKEGATSGGGKGDPNLLTSTDLTNTGFTDLYQAVEKLRPSWITGQRSSAGAVVAPTYFFNGVKSTTGASDMHNYLIANTLEVRFIRASDARGKYGDDGNYGVIEVRLK